VYVYVNVYVYVYLMRHHCMHHTLTHTYHLASITFRSLSEKLMIEKMKEEVGRPILLSHAETHTNTTTTRTRPRFL
jgi:hypothetical protein